MADTRKTQDDLPVKTGKGAEIDITIKHGPVDAHRTGVGTPDKHVEAAGAALGGDTGDVGTPRDTVGGSPGGTYGTTRNPNGSSVMK